MMFATAAEGRDAVKDETDEMIDLIHVKPANKPLERAASIGGRS